MMGHIHEKIDWVASVFIVNNDKVLLVHHKKLGRWLPIGGHVELDEDPEQALYREVKEECGLEIELLNSKRVGFEDFDHCKSLPTPDFLDIHRVGDSHRHIGLTYLASAKSDKAVLAEKEHNDIRWFSLEDLRNPEFNLYPSIIFYCEAALKAAAD